ncbi:MAG: molybdopterin-guanine dinucleotide biosynthesis protein B [Candidatus Helarchaeales archaeon]
MIFTVSIVGLHESGKTTLMEKIIARLEKNLNVGTIKHSRKTIEIDREGSDSWRHFKAGAIHTCISSPTLFVLIQKTKKELPLKKILYLMERARPNLDIILIEGYKEEKIPKIIITDDPAFLESFDENEILAVISNKTFECKQPIFKHDDVDEIVNVILKAFNKKESKHDTHERMKVELKVNKKNVAFNRFVGDILGNAFLSLVTLLKGIEKPREIEIEVSYPEFRLMSREAEFNAVLNLQVNGKNIPLRSFVQHQFINLLTSILLTLKLESPPKNVELLIKWIGT